VLVEVVVVVQEEPMLVPLQLQAQQTPVAVVAVVVTIQDIWQAALVDPALLLYVT
jgi:hypothetical protein